MSRVLQLGLDRLGREPAARCGSAGVRAIHRPVTHLRCVNCGSLLTRECRWGALEEYDQEAAGRAPAVAPGVMVRLLDEDAAGFDGPNRACATCGAVVATGWSDCWTQAEIRFLPEAVEAA